MILICDSKVVANSFIDYNESCKLLVVLTGNSVIHTTVNNDQDVKTSIISVVKILKAYDFLHMHSLCWIAMLSYA